jgi:hypothetical protein
MADPRPKLESDRFHWTVRAAAFVAVLVVGVFSLRIVLVNAFLYVLWADALSYAEGARHVFAGTTPYSAMQLTGPYFLDDASFGLGFVYPPTGAYLLAPFLFGEPFWYVWNALSLAAVVGVVLLIVRQELGRLTAVVAIATAALAVTLLQPGLSELRTGYLSPMVAAAFGAAWLWPRWSAFPALLFGLIKVFPGAALVWTVRKGGHWVAPLVGAIAAALLVTVVHPSFLSDWITSIGNAVPGCPEFALFSFGCLGIPVVGYVVAGVLLIAAWRVPRDDVSFLLLGLALTAPLPDIYWGNLMVPMIAGIPLALRLARPTLERLGVATVGAADEEHQRELVDHIPESAHSGISASSPADRTASRGSTRRRAAPASGSGRSA